MTLERSVELRGFEPLTPSLRTRCSARLSYSPFREREFYRWACFGPDRVFSRQLDPYTGLTTGGFRTAEVFSETFLDHCCGQIGAGAFDK